MTAPLFTTQNATQLFQRGLAALAIILGSQMILFAKNSLKDQVSVIATQMGFAKNAQAICIALLQNLLAGSISVKSV